MALLQYFKLKKQKEHLPDPNGPLSQKISSANACVGKLPAFDIEGTSSTTSQSRGPYTVLTPAQKFDIGKRAAEIGTTATIRYYAKRYPDISLKETSVRRFKEVNSQFVV